MAAIHHFDQRTAISTFAFLQRDTGGPRGDFSQSVHPDSGSIEKVRGDLPKIRAHLRDYGCIADFLSDETIACAICATRWYQPSLDRFDADLMASDCIFVCETCAGDHNANAPTIFDQDRREHGTLYARNGAVVG